MSSIRLRGWFVAFVLVLAGTGAFGDGEHPKYTLGKDALQNAADRAAVWQDASFWKDENGNFGEAGAPLDTTGDYYYYYSSTFSLATSGLDTHVNVHSVQLGEVGGDSVKFYDYVNNPSRSFGVLNEGLFLNKGILYSQYLPFIISDTVTVQSPATDPFQIRSTYGFNDPDNSQFSSQYGTFSATFKSAVGAELWIYHSIQKVQVKSDGTNSTYRFEFTGDYSGYFGTLRFGKDDESDGLVTKAVFSNGAFPGTLKLMKSSLLSVGAFDQEVANLELSDGASIETAGGALVVTGAMTLSGAVNVALGEVPNVEIPKVAVLTVPLAAAVDESAFAVSCPGAADVALDWRINGDGTKSLVATVTRPAVYVSPAGDDAAAGDAEHPFKTLAHAVSAISDGVVYALPGTYDEGVCDVDEPGRTNVQSRVLVPPRVFLKSTAGARETIIVGAKPTSGENIGAGATRCARLDAGAVLQGFTLTGGFGSVEDNDTDRTNRWGGAVYAEESGVVMDAIITNNFARRGGAVFGGTYVRCYFNGNSAPGGGTDAFAQPNYKTRIFDSVFAANKKEIAPIYFYVEAYNCAFTGTKGGSPKHTCKAYNCVIYDADENSRPYGHSGSFGANIYKNCIFAVHPAYESEADYSANVIDCKVISDLSTAYDADGHPLATGGKYAIDAGDRAAYAAYYPAAVAGGKDYAGGQRIYNGQIDVGVYEYDWRSNYTAVVDKPYMEVTTASPDVLDEEDGARLKLVDGGALNLDWDCRGTGVGARITCTAAVAGTGTLKIAVDGALVYTLASGSANVVLRSASPIVHAVAFTFAGEGEATVGAFRNTGGSVIVIR